MQAGTERPGQPGAAPQVPVQHLSDAGEAAQGEEDQEGLGLLVDLGRAQVVHPPLQNIGALLRAQADLERRRVKTDTGPITAPLPRPRLGVAALAMPWRRC